MTTCHWQSAHHCQTVWQAFLLSPFFITRRPSLELSHTWTRDEKIQPMLHKIFSTLCAHLTERFLGRTRNLEVFCMCSLPYSAMLPSQRRQCRRAGCWEDEEMRGGTISACYSFHQPASCWLPCSWQWYQLQIPAGFQNLFLDTQVSLAPTHVSK